MFYLGLRSSSRYLDALASVRNDARPTSLVTVAGGLAFLHAISAHTRSLVIVDQDPDTLRHWSIVRSLLGEATSLTDFLTLLTGREARGTFLDGTTTMGPATDISGRLARALSADDLALYTRTYGALIVDDAGVGHHPEFTVHFVGMDFRPMHFNWQFGEGNLASEATFEVLREQVARLPIRIEHTRLEQLDYSAIFPADAPAGARVFLASNCESPLFTNADAIFLRVLETATHAVRYITWHRDVMIGSGTVREARTSSAPGAAPTVAETSLLRDGSSGVEASDGAYRRTALNLAELRAKPEYGSPRLVVRGYTSNEVRSMLIDLAPAFLEVLWAPVSSTAAPDFSLPNYLADGTALFEGQPAWRFRLVGGH